jgi:REP element-mobilizing transposase RayT
MAQSLARQYTHLVFSVSGREPRIAGEWREELYRVIGGTLNNIGCLSIIVGGTADHVHVLFVLSRTVALSEAVKTAKAMSSAWVNEKFGPKPIQLATGLRCVFREPVRC